MVLSSAYTSISSFNPHTKEGTLQHGGIAVKCPRLHRQQRLSWEGKLAGSLGDLPPNHAAVSLFSQVASASKPFLLLCFSSGMSSLLSFHWTTPFYPPEARLQSHGPHEAFPGYSSIRLSSGLRLQVCSLWQHFPTRGKGLSRIVTFLSSSGTYTMQRVLHNRFSVNTESMIAQLTGGVKWGW